MLTTTKFFIFRLQLRDLTLVGQTNNKERNKQKGKQIPQKAKTNPTKKTNPTNRNAFSSSFHSEKWDTETLHQNSLCSWWQPSFIIGLKDEMELGRLRSGNYEVPSHTILADFCKFGNTNTSSSTDVTRPLLVQRQGALAISFHLQIIRKCQKFNLRLERV